MGAGRGRARRAQSVFGSRGDAGAPGTQPVREARVAFLQNQLLQRYAKTSVAAALMGFSLAAFHPAPAQANPARAAGLGATTGAVRAGAEASVRATLSQPFKTCSLLSHGKALSSAHPQRDVLTWSWRVPKKARSSTQPLEIACDAERVGLKLAIHGHGHEKSLRTGGVRLKQSGASLRTPVAPASAPKPSLAPPDPILPVSQHATLTQSAWEDAQKDWQQWSPADLLTEFHDGQCVELAEGRRPDVVSTTMQILWAEDIMQGDHVLPWPNWDATFWDKNAAQAGFGVSATPADGDLIVWQSTNDAAWPGHIAYVERVNPDGSIVISEEHAPSLWVTDQRTVTAQEMSGQALDFISTTDPVPTIVPDPAPTETIPADTAPPVMSGSAVVGGTLSVTPGSWSGTPAPAVSYQWQRVAPGSSAAVNISGATSPSYQVNNSDLGDELEVQVVATNSAGKDTVTLSPSPVVSARATASAASLRGGVRSTRVQSRVHGNARPSK